MEKCSISYANIYYFRPHLVHFLDKKRVTCFDKSVKSLFLKKEIIMFFNKQFCFIFICIISCSSALALPSSKTDEQLKSSGKAVVIGSGVIDKGAVITKTQKCPGHSTSWHNGKCRHYSEIQSNVKIGK